MWQNWPQESWATFGGGSRGLESSVDRDTGLSGGWGLAVPAPSSWRLCVTETTALCHVRGSL